MGVPYVKEEMKQAGDGADKKLMRAKKGNEKADDFMAKDINQNSIRTVDENTDWIGRERNNSEVRDFAVR